MRIERKGEDAYFAASNSRDGFCSYYPQCFDAARVGRVYAVKGGPGTGKSRFLRDVATAGEAAGWTGEYVYCSSDPDSLDGVILTGQREGECVALLDATAPHVYEPRLPGVREEIINLGAFWDAERLASLGGEIEEQNRLKSAAYRQAYRYLSAVGEMQKTLDEVALPFIRRDAIERFAERLLREVPNGTAYSLTPALIGSFGMHGAVRLDSYAAQAERLFWVEDCHGSAQYLLAAIGNVAVKKRLRVRVSYDPILPDRLDAIFLCDSRTAFVVSVGEHDTRGKRLSMRRFVQTASMHRVKPTLGYATRMKRAMLGGAAQAMEQVKAAHFQIEKLYFDAMDFDAKERFTAAFCSHLFS